MEKKLTLVSVYARGRRISEFIYITPCKDGKVRMTGRDITNLFNKHNVEIHRGTTVSVG